MNRTTCILFVGLLWISPGTSSTCRKKQISDTVRNCFKSKTTHLIVADNFNSFINSTSQNQTGKNCTVFLQKNGSFDQNPEQLWPIIEEKGGNFLLYLSKFFKNLEVTLYFLQGKVCKDQVHNLTGSQCDPNYGDTGNCTIRCIMTEDCKKSTYDDAVCPGHKVNDKYIINMTTTNEFCINCDNPVKQMEVNLSKEFLTDKLGKITPTGGEINATQAAGVMNHMAKLAEAINGSSASLNLGEGVTGAIVRETEPLNVEEISLAYKSPGDNMNIIESRDKLASYSRSVTVTKEAFEQAVKLNVSVPFAAVLRFTNMTKDEKNSNVLGNEVLAVEMGATIINLTDKIDISFRNIIYKGIPSCQSWNGEGNRPNWTGDGCQTNYSEKNITCRCSHLTFFAILLSPLNETISSSDLKNLTIITQVGCGLSMFFLSIVLFMHFLLRKTKASKATKILIHLVFAMFLLNFTFLINNYVANMKNSVGCKIMAALMHYFMLATFTWFAVQAFHLCLQMYAGGKIVIRHYIRKVSIISWLLPSIIAIVLLSTGKYGEQVIQTGATEGNVAMCWITDSDVHYIVNIGYYVLVFLFTFTTFIVILSWLFCLRKTKTATAKTNTGGKNIVTILGLCCVLGVTWGFAFFAYGVLRIPSYYIFTVLNSFQGFFLFIYYYNTSHSGEINGGGNALKNLNSSSSSSSTLKTSVDSFANPYSNQPDKINSSKTKEQ